MNTIELLTLLRAFETATANSAFYRYTNLALADSEALKATEVKRKITDMILALDDKVVLTKEQHLSLTTAKAVPVFDYTFIDNV